MPLKSILKKELNSTFAILKIVNRWKHP